MQAKPNTSKLFLQLDDNAGRNGLIIGQQSKTVLRRRIAQNQQVINKQKIPARIIRARLNDFRRILRMAAPHWLAEVQGMARGAGVQSDDILLMNCQLPDNSPGNGMNCTTWLSVGSDENQLLKIRDERNRVQTFYVVRMTDGASMQYAKDIGNLGTAHFHNTRPLAGANNTGSHIRLSDAARLNDCHVLRFIGENARNTREIPRLFDFLTSRKLAGGAARERGAIYTFIDDEQGLQVETGCDDFNFKFIKRGDLVIANHYLLRQSKKWMTQPANDNTLTRKVRMEELLGKITESGQRPTPAKLFAVTRDRKHAPDALCNDDQQHFWMTISAQLHVINRRVPAQSINFICCGNTRHSVFMPIPLSVRESFAPLVNGKFYERSNRLYRQYKCRNHMTKVQSSFENWADGETDTRLIYRRAYTLLNTTQPTAAK